VLESSFRILRLIVESSQVDEARGLGLLVPCLLPQPQGFEMIVEGLVELARRLIKSSDVVQGAGLAELVLDAPEELEAQVLLQTVVPCVCRRCPFH
jgi:hypothetical protein